MFRTAKNFAVRTLVRSVEPYNYHNRNVALSIVGYQFFRICAYELSYAVRGIFFRGKNLPVPNPASTNGPLDSETSSAALIEHGLLKIESYFPPEKFAALEEAYEKALGRVEYRTYISGGLIKTVSINYDDPSPECQFIYQTFVNDSFLNDLVCRVRRGGLSIPPRIILQTIHQPDGKEDAGDANSVPHADRHYHHGKLFFYMNDQDADAGAYSFAEGSHKYDSFARIVHELDIDFRNSLTAFRQWLGLKPSQKLYRLGLDEIRPSLAQGMNCRLASIDGPKNSFVFTDNRGIHSRGLMKPGRTRKQIRIQYQYLHMPWYGRFSLWLASRFKPMLWRAYH
jgi:hypothetical protein